MLRFIYLFPEQLGWGWARFFGGRDNLRSCLVDWLCVHVFLHACVSQEEGARMSGCGLRGEGLPCCLLGP